MVDLRICYRVLASANRAVHLFHEMKNVVFVLGPPGSGKGTQCERIFHHFGYVHLSAGELLRKERVNPKSKHHETLEHCQRDLKVVPSEITYKLLIEAIEKTDSQHFLVDAFPMNEENLNHWNKEVSNDIHLQFVLHFDCPQEVCVERCLKRGTADSRRHDDNVEALRKRFLTYTNDSMPVIEHYKTLNLLRPVFANRSPDKVFDDVKSIFDNEKLNN